MCLVLQLTKLIQILMDSMLCMTTLLDDDWPSIPEDSGNYQPLLGLRKAKKLIGLIVQKI